MSTFQPKGTKIEFNGEDRYLIWDYGVIEKVQEKYGGHPIVAIESIFWQDSESGLRHYQAKPMLDLMEILLNNEIARQKYFEGKSDLKTYTRQELGFLIDRENADGIASAIVESWTGSSVAEDKDEEKNV